MSHYETSRKLANLGKQIPREWLKKGVQEIDYGKEQKEKIQRMVNTGLVEKRVKWSPGAVHRVRVSDKSRRVLQSQIDKGMFDNKKKEINKDYEKKISNAWDQIIRGARERGELPSVSQAQVEYNKFMASRRQR